MIVFRNICCCAGWKSLHIPIAIIMISGLNVFKCIYIFCGRRSTKKCSSNQNARSEHFFLLSYLPVNICYIPTCLLIIPIHWLASSLCLLSTSKLVCGGLFGTIWLPSHHPGGCCTLVVDEETECPPFYVKRFEYPEKHYINVINYYYMYLHTSAHPNRADRIRHQRVHALCA